jgi:hypothetical protein
MPNELQSKTGRLQQGEKQHGNRNISVEDIIS